MNFNDFQERRKKAREARQKANTKMLADLKERGYSIEITHRHYSSVSPLVSKNRVRVMGKTLADRSTHNFLKGSLPYTPVRHVTTVYVAHPEQDAYFIGESYCSWKDHYNHDLGLAIALGRVTKQTRAVPVTVNA